MNLEKIHFEATTAAKIATQTYIRDHFFGDPDIGVDGPVVLIIKSYENINLLRNEKFITTMLSLGAISYPNYLLGIRIKNPSKIICKSRIAKFKGGVAALKVWRQYGFEAQLQTSSFGHQIV